MSRTEKIIIVVAIGMVTLMFVLLGMTIQQNIDHKKIVEMRQDSLESLSVLRDCAIRLKQTERITDQCITKVEEQAVESVAMQQALQKCFGE